MKARTRILSLLLSLVMVLGMLSMSAFAADIIDSGYCGGEGDGTNLTWTLNSEGLLTISGDGIMKDYSSISDLPWNNRLSSIKQVLINDGVTSLSQVAFCRCSNLSSVVIGDSVKSVGSDAFYNCTKLEKITIGNSVEIIGDSAFYGCSNLERISLPDSVTTIESWAFRWCTSLSEIVIGHGVRTIESWAFIDCPAITDVYYVGTEEEWNEISIGYVNGNLTGANIRFSYVREDEDDSIIDFLLPVEQTDVVPVGYIGIYTADDLSNVRNEPDKKYILMTDIDLSEYSWIAINEFRGVLDGNGYSIIYEYNGGIDDALFYRITNGVIQNLCVIMNANSTTNGIGALSAYCENSHFQNIVCQGKVNVPDCTEETLRIGGFITEDENSDFSYCRSAIQIDITAKKTVAGYVGGFVGYSEGSKFFDSVNNSTIDIIATDGTEVYSLVGAFSLNIGGFVGLSEYTEINNSTNNSELIITATSTKGSRFKVGGFIGYIDDAEVQDVINNSNNYGNITVELFDYADSAEVGGFIGVSYGKLGKRYSGVKLHNCSNYATINVNTANMENSGGFSYSGGITGRSNSANIDYCSNFGDLSFSTYCGHVGGISGLDNFSTYRYCTNDGDISCNDVGSSVYVGGLLSGTNDSELYNCTNQGNITVEAEQSVEISGIAGSGPNGASYIYECGNIGDIFATSVSGKLTVGGIASMFSDNIMNCYNAGDISAVSQLDTVQNQVGGIVGYGAYSYTVKNTYNIGEIVTSSASSFCGGIVGNNQKSTSSSGMTYIREKCYTIDSVPLSGNNGVEFVDSKQLTDAEMQQAESFSGFDFENIWEIGTTEDYPYPTLQKTPHNGVFDIVGTLPTIENFTLNGQTSDLTVEVGDQLTIGGIVNGNGSKIKALQVSIFQNGDHTLGGVFQRVEPDAETYDLSQMPPIETGKTYGNLLMGEGVYDVCIYVTLENGGSFGDNLPTRTVTVTKESACAHTSEAPLTYVQTLFREIAGDHEFHEAYADIYSGICDLCHEPFEVTYERSEDQVERVLHSYTDGVCQSTGCGHVCPHSYDFKLVNGEPVPVEGSGKWTMIDENYCQKSVRYWMVCEYCKKEVEGTEHIPEDENIQAHDPRTTIEITQLPADHADYSTKHQVTTTYVACSRNCGYTVGNSTKTTTEEHTFVNGVCACGFMEEVRPVWDFDTDSYSFLNSYAAFGEKPSPIYVKQEHLDEWLANLSDADLYNVAKQFAKREIIDCISGPITQDLWLNRLRNNDLRDWSGSCYGMSLMMGFYRTGALSTEVFDNAACTKELPTLTSDENSDLESLINIFNMTQALRYIKNKDTTILWKVGSDIFFVEMQKLWTYASSINEETIEKIFMLGMGNDLDEPSHAVLCYGTEKGNWNVDGKTYTRRFLLADPNCITKPNYVYVTQLFDDAVYSYWNEAKQCYVQGGYMTFGPYKIDLDADLLDNLKIPNVFRDKQSNEKASASATVQNSAENYSDIVISFFGNHACTISSATGSVTIENGTVFNDSLGVQIHRQSNILENGESEYNNDCFLFLPKGEEYEIVSSDGEMLEIVVDYGGLVFGVNGSIQSINFGIDRTFSVSGTGNAIDIDVVNDDSVFDFLSIYGQPSSNIVIKAEKGQVQVEGDWLECTASHLDRDWNTSEVQIADSSDFALTVDGENNLRVDYDNNSSPDPNYPSKPVGSDKPEKEVPSFKDVSKNDWFYDAVEYVYANGLMRGTSADTFAPDMTTTRGMIVTILHRLEGTPKAAPCSFTDVAANQYYTEAVHWAAANGIVTGYNSNTFGPNDPITREQMAAILYRYTQYKGYDVSIGESTNILSFADVNQLGEWAVPAMQWACGENLISGVGNGRLAPKGNATRAQVAMILMRYCKNVMKK